MTEQAEDLRATLDTLHEQLEASDNLGEEARSLLTETLREILAKLAEEDHDAKDEPTNWVDRLRGSIEHFEDSHPDLVHAVDGVARALARVGF
ncbi:MAG: hypothetical protein DRJ42_24620 [Deltaproteobacteria bacterium]|nr:MAG: hypothetical protein DRJ42_24620 [Deltaproteobacteria bacterium]